jgi:hypothetical protein
MPVDFFLRIDGIEGESVDVRLDREALAGHHSRLALQRGVVQVLADRHLDRELRSVFAGRGRPDAP